MEIKDLKTGMMAVLTQGTELVMEIDGNKHVIGDDFNVKITMYNTHHILCIYDIDYTNPMSTEIHTRKLIWSKIKKGDLLFCIKDLKLHSGEIAATSGSFYKVNEDGQGTFHFTNDQGFKGHQIRYSSADEWFVKVSDIDSISGIYHVKLK